MQLRLRLILVLVVWSATALQPARAASPVRPEYRRRLEVPLLASGAAVFGIGELINTEHTFVPPEGLDPGGIHLELDQRVVHNSDMDSGAASNWMRNASIAFPLVLSAVSAPPGEHVRATLHRGLLYAECWGLAGGVTALLKTSISRPRPFAYQSASNRPTDSLYDASSDRAFESMPSGHATTGWCAATFGIVDHLLTRPQGGWLENAAVGFAGGCLATTTSALRVEAGQHFPTDVMVGAGIGITSGVTVPLAHRYLANGARVPLPPRRAWLEAVAGTLAGIGTGLLIAPEMGSQ